MNSGSTWTAINRTNMSTVFFGLNDSGSGKPKARRSKELFRYQLKLITPQSALKG
jgi:hypothetical protein